MATRSQFSYTVIAADTNNSDAIGSPLKSLAGIEYTVYQIDSSGNRDSEPEIFTGKTTGTFANFTDETDADGLIEFWANPGEYEIDIADTVSPARISNRTITWSSVAAQEGSLSGDFISNDAQLDLPTLGDDIVRQTLPIGSVIDWWRPADSGISVPSGFVICDGSTYQSNDHDFGTNAPITVPDLRNKFVLGASISKSDNASATLGTAGASEADPTNAPGIGGKGGSNGARNLTHNHNVPAHKHGRGTLGMENNGSHSHGFRDGTTLNQTSVAGGHAHTAEQGAAFVVQTVAGNYANYYNSGITNDNGGGYRYSNSNYTGDHRHSFTIDSNGSHGHTLTGTIGATGSTNDGDSGFNTEAASANISATHDFRPSYVGLLKIIKIRRA